MWEIKKICSKGIYNYAVVENHPNATKQHYVLEHRVVMENNLGRLLSKDEVVHHLNGNKKDNRIENLQFLTNSEHSRLHGFEQGKNYVELICPECKLIFEKPKNQSFLQKGTIYTCCSKKCRGKFSSYIQYNGMTEKAKNAIANNLIREFKRFNNS